VSVINGMNVVHRCRNSTFVLDTVEKSQKNSVLLKRAMKDGETLESLFSFA
jgi:hypothetical protein